MEGVVFVMVSSFEFHSAENEWLAEQTQLCGFYTREPMAIDPDVLTVCETRLPRRTNPTETERLLEKQPNYWSLIVYLSLLFQCALSSLCKTTLQSTISERQA